MKSSLRILGVAVLSVIVAVASSACSSGGGSSSSRGNTLTITGKVSGGSQTKRLWLDRFFAWIFPSAHALNPNDVSKVIVFWENGRYVTSPVANGSFSIEVETGSPVGLIFVGVNNNYLGYLALENGIDSLPLTKLAPGVNTINLENLSSSSDGIVAPSRNPIGPDSALPLTPEEQTAVAHGDDFFASVIKNPDVDGDNKLDFLSGKFYRPFIMYFITGGSFEGSLTPTVNSPARITEHRFCFDVYDKAANFPDTVSFTGPEGSGLSESSNDQQPNKYPDSATYCSGLITGSLPPGGEYTVSYKTDTTLTFNIPDQRNAPDNIVLAVPTVTLNANGTIQKIKWGYRLGSKIDATLDPLVIIDSIELQIDGSGTRCASYPQQSRIYNSGMLSATTTEHVLTCQNLSWSTVTRIYMAYNDVYGNHYVVKWDKQNQL